MESILAELAAALRERLAIVGDEASRKDEAAHIRRLQAVSERIEALERQVSQTADPQLRHYLQRRSYTKALEYLEAAK